ncbi:MAG: pyridoxal-phosphate dependent enzyme [Candidatus Riflebacteria bacterium]|nr:pyridoxal-phosphate dependent enzyme [Candidatus Riflebacteria bacterium]
MRVVKKINEAVLAKTVNRCRERKIIIPTFAEQKDPTRVPEKIKRRLRDVGLWDVNPLNLFRITWKNEPKEKGGLYNTGNWLEFPPEVTGVPARIVGMIGKYFPTGAHKVGAAFGCLVPRLVSGEFDSDAQKAAWPSTGNYCRGGAFDCALLACKAIAILPEEMSKERFEWLRAIGTDEIIATPGSESNVKEIYDKCWELKKQRSGAVLIFNQFEEFGNALWHYNMTGANVEGIFGQIRKADSRLAAYVSATGSAGTIAAGDYLRTRFPHVKVVATEALQCPTLLRNGWGAHRIEGIGDKHVPWIHNVRNTDMVAAIDDEQCMSILRLFNEEEGIGYLESRGVKRAFLDQLSLVGISAMCNLVAAIKAARYYELSGRDVLFFPMTDSMDLYKSRKQELRDQHGAYTRDLAAQHFGRYLMGAQTDNLRELGYWNRKALHNLKYFTWVEQQGKSSADLEQLWDPDFWTDTFSQMDEWDKLINQFNQRTGVLEALD